MAMGKPKGILGIALSTKPSGDDEESEIPSTPGGDAKMRASEDALAAFESGDAAALNDALTRHYKACAAETGSDSEEY